MVTKKHVILLSDVALETRSLIVVESDTFVVVIGKIMCNKLSGLIERQQPLN
jgi:hypothetical protein